MQRTKGTCPKSSHRCVHSIEIDFLVRSLAQVFTMPDLLFSYWGGHHISLGISFRLAEEMMIKLWNSTNWSRFSIGHRPIRENFMIHKIHWTLTQTYVIEKRPTFCFGHQMHCFAFLPKKKTNNAINYVECALRQPQMWMAEIVQCFSGIDCLDSIWTQFYRSLHLHCKHRFVQFLSVKTWAFHHFDIFRWLRPLVKTSLTRDLNEDDIYEARDSMQSAQITDAFERLWQLELDKKNPSIIRVMFKLYGFEVLLITFLYSIASTTVR